MSPPSTLDHMRSLARWLAGTALVIYLGIHLVQDDKPVGWAVDLILLGIAILGALFWLATSEPIRRRIPFKVVTRDSEAGALGGTLLDIGDLTQQLVAIRLGSNAPSEAQQAIQKMKDEFHYVTRRLDELDDGALGEVLHNPVLRESYRALPTEAWNNYASVARAGLSDQEYVVVRTSYFDIDQFNRSVIDYPAGPIEPDIDALRSSVTQAESVLP